jgi:hypothetical protein
MAVALVNSTTKDCSGVLSDTQAFDCGSANLLVVVIGWRNNNTQDPTVTYNGTSMTQATNIAGSWGNKIFYLANPSAGSNNIVVTAANIFNGASYIAASFSGVDASGTPVGTGTTTNGTGTSASSTAATVSAGGLLVDCLVTQNDQSAALAANGGNTSIQIFGITSPTAQTVASSYESGSGSVSTGWSWTNSIAWWLAALPLNPAASLTKKLKLLAHPSAVGATGCTVEVFAEPSAGDLTGTKFGKATGQEWVTGTGADTGFAVMKIPVADFSGSALAVNDTPVALVENTTHATVRLADPYSIVIEE